ncbi:MAG: guanylate kinase [Dehalococcoidales bacterium]|jgi:guanylate kinase|nr:guanylate kinase [Dehalococcoidales bacterium]
MTRASPRDSLRSDQPSPPLLIVLSGPSGAGKDALLARLRETGCPLECITTLTTRPRRAKETDKLDYHFVSTDKFQEMIKNNELLEWANVYGNWYGVPKQPIKSALENGRDTIVKVDTQGAATIKRLLPQAVFVFLMPPSAELLSERLTQRRTESPFDLALRLKTARKEIEQLPLFDYLIINRCGEIDRAAAQIEAIITAEKCRAEPRKIAL